MSAKSLSRWLPGKHKNIGNTRERMGRGQVKIARAEVARLTGERDAGAVRGASWRRRALDAEAERDALRADLVHERARVDKEWARARAAALCEAANEVRTEARWQREQQMRGMFANGERSVDRLLLVERILRERAAALAPAAPSPDSTEET